MILLVLLAAALFLAYANGANDNFKPVATVYGSATLDYHRALAWGTLSQLLGSFMALWLAHGLVKQFSGKGLVPAELVGQSSFLVSVALGAALAVMAATRLGLPISTTHSLTGALAGAGLVLSAQGVRLGVLGSKFFLPLAFSPLLALGLAFTLYPLARRARLRLRVEKETCLCVGPAPQPVTADGRGQMIHAVTGLALGVDEVESCQALYRGRVVGISAQTLVDLGHLLSSGALGFARGLNDTPKVLAVLLAAEAVGVGSGAGANALLVAVGVVMAAGGLLHSRRLATTLGEGITSLNRGQGLISNLVASVLVIWASRLGLPVSTTHVSCGSIFGIGLAQRRGDLKLVATIVLAWVGTLPLAAGLAAGVAWMAKTLGA